MQDPDKSLSYLKAADTKPSLLLKGKAPRLIDEWQMAPVLWDAVRHMVDRRGNVGQFILTGSAVPKDNAVQHTGTGRISRMMMRPMSLYESLESEGSVSLKRATDYVEAVIHADVSSVDGIDKNPVRVRALMRSLARNISTFASLKSIREDISIGNDETISDKTVSQYMNALNRIFVTEDVPAWNPVLRSKTAIRSASKRQLVDPSIAAAVTRLSPDRLLEDFNYFGFLFESLCDRDLRIYAQANDGEVFHYRDKSGLEADAVVCLRDGRWAAIEIKLGAKEIEEAAEHLKILKEKVNTEKMKEPSFLMILTGTDLAYRREDGVFIVPIGCLKD